MRLIYSLLCGFILGLGFVISGMADPNKVLNFFDIFGQWDPSLAFVMAGGLVVNIIGYQLAKGQKRPLIDGDSFNLATASKAIGPRLILGSVLFGVGWGIAGFCPGPAVAALASPSIYPIAFIGAVIGGMIAVRLFDRVFSS